MNAKRIKYESEEPEEEILGGGSTLVKGESDEDIGERQEALQRDLEPDDYDAGTNVSDDRVRGAGGQSLDELALTYGQGRGLEEHIGGLRQDRPEPNVNDLESEEDDLEAS
ncbi:MAG TPA: hypothetical protein VIH99_04210 [Bdellovibrionota bacterium]|jgi:hypothetical protein